MPARAGRELPRAGGTAPGQAPPHKLQPPDLQTPRSVDELVEDVVSLLSELGVLDNTYILYTSDNGE